MVSGFRHVVLGISWDDTKRSGRLGIAFGVLTLMLLIQAPTATPTHLAGGPATTVIVRLQPAGGGGPARFIIAAGGQVGERLDIIDGFVASVPERAIAGLEKVQGVASVTVDRAVGLHGDSYAPAADPGSLQNAAAVIGAPALWARGVSGQGVDVAIVDSGVTPVDGLSGSRKVFYGPDFSSEGSSPNRRGLDGFGHGTFMAGIVGGSAADFSGIAPGARLVSVKAADAEGQTDLARVIAAIGWVVSHRHEEGLNIRVLNLSFGSPSRQSYQSDPLAAAAEAAWRSGIVVVVAAGNTGPDGGLTDPGFDPRVLTVGATGTSGGAVAPFSAGGDGVRNPDLLAPGSHVQSLRVPGSFIDVNFGSTGRINDRFFRGSGTSESAAMVSGSVALLLQQQPWLEPEQVKALLSSTATPLPSVSPRVQGHGLESIAAAATAAVAELGGQSGRTSEQSASSEPFDHLAAAGRAWTGTSWTGTSWTGTSWTGTSWTGTSWTGTSWTGTSWTGSTWTGSTWTGASWSSFKWS